MIPEDETKPLPPNARLDAGLRVVIGAVLLFGGGFLLLEFVHWLANGGLRPFLVGAAFTTLFFFILTFWARLLAQGGRTIQRRPSLYTILALLTAGGVLGQHFLMG